MNTWSINDKTKELQIKFAKSPTRLQNKELSKAKFNWNTKGRYWFKKKANKEDIFLAKKMTKRENPVMGIV